MTEETQDEHKIPDTLNPELQAQLAKFRAARAFNATAWIHAKCKMFNEHMTRQGLSACLVSLSGGVDSAVTLALMKYAQQMPGSPILRVGAISQPIHSAGWARDRALEAGAALGVEIITIDQSAIYDTLKDVVDGAVSIEGNRFAGGQLKSYMRTPCAYYVAQLLSQAGTPCCVMGTGNKDEDGYLAYFCKAGDGVVDIQLIADLHKSQVFEVGRVLGVPDSILSAAPSADLWDGQTDEEELGFTYDFIELWTNYLELTEGQRIVFRSELSEDANRQLESWGLKAEQVHLKNAHKLDAPKNLNYTKTPTASEVEEAAKALAAWRAFLAAEPQNKL